MRQPFASVTVMAVALLIAGCGREKNLSSGSPDALRAYGEGVLQWERFYYTEAKSSFEHALRFDSTFAMAWCRLAMIDARTGNRREARDVMNRALRNAVRATRREQLFISMWNHSLEFDNAGAAAAADSLLDAYPAEKEACVFRGNLYEELDKNFDAALRCYQRAVEIDSLYAQAVMSLGYAYSLLGDEAKAVEQMQRYIGLAPDAADPRASYGDILVRAGKYDEALEQYRKSLALKPDYWYAVRGIGTVEATLGRLAEAQQQYHKSLALLPPGSQIESARLILDASLDMHRNKFAEAAGEYRRALQIDSIDVDAAYGCVRALGKLKDFAEGRQVVVEIYAGLVRRHLTNSPAMLSYYLTRAALLTDEEEFEHALACCDSALACSVPLTRPAVFRQKAEAHFAQGSLEDALDDCDQALEINPNSPPALLLLTKVYHRKGDTLMTVEIGSRLLALWSGADPDFADRNELLRLLGKEP